MSDFGAKSWAKLWRVVNQLWSLRFLRRKILALPLCTLAFALMYSWSVQSNSCALIAFSGLILFDVLTLVGDLVAHFYAQFGKSSPSLSLSYVRVEVLVHFTVLSLGLLTSAWALKMSLDLLSAGAISSHAMQMYGRFIPTLILGASIHFFVCLQSNPYVMVSKVSSTCTYLQKWFQGLCAGFGLSLSSSSDFAFRNNPLAILGAFSACVIAMLSFLLPASPRWVDFFGGLMILFATVNTLWPLSCYTGQILLQTVPAHTLTQLDKALREALTIDGVLEFRNEMFWTLSYGQIAGSLHVRVRRDANEQFILMQVYEKLFPLAQHLTIQVTKDEAGRHHGGVQQLIRGMGAGTGGPIITTTVINMEKSSETEASPAVSLSDASPMSPIPSAFAHKHIIYSTASGSGGSNQPRPKHGHFNARNISTSTKLNAEDTYADAEGDINETALNMADSSIGSVLSSTTSSVFPVETPARENKKPLYNIPELVGVMSDAFTYDSNSKPAANLIFANARCNNALNAEYARQNPNPLFTKRQEAGVAALRFNYNAPRTFY